MLTTASFTLTLTVPTQCLGNLPHDDALSPIVDPAVSHIPPVNTSGSYWDDIVYIHMDVNTRVRPFPLVPPLAARHATCSQNAH